MPELPEVEIASRALNPLLIGKRILDFWSNWPRGLRVSSLRKTKRDIAGRKIEKIERRGKAIMLELSGNRLLAFHQKMSGKLLVIPKNSGDKHIHFRLPLSSGDDLVLHDVRKFGVVWYGDKKNVEAKPYFASLGKDALRIPFIEFQEALRDKKGALKPLLLRQDILAGVGNIVADEALWRAGLHPRRRAESLSSNEMKTLWSSLQFILSRSIRLGGSTMRDWLRPDSSPGGYFQKRFAYGRKGEACPRCKESIIRLVVAFRGTFICPVCQQED